jgi:hypothetical protein
LGRVLIDRILLTEHLKLIHPVREEKFTVERQQDGEEMQTIGDVKVTDSLIILFMEAGGLMSICM